jgi:ribosomal protein L37AE/L43A
VPSSAFIAEREILVLSGASARVTVFPVSADPRYAPRSGMSPNPTALRSLVKEEEVEKHRSLSCAAYDDCLEAALRSSWRSWSCDRCQLFAYARKARAAETWHEASLRPLA